MFSGTPRLTIFGALKYAKYAFFGAHSPNMVKWDFPEKVKSYDQIKFLADLPIVITK